MSLASQQPENKIVPHRQWEEALPSEIDFWREQIATRGGQWSQEFMDRLDPNLPVQGNIVSRLNAPLGATVEILDVGAGPLTFVGKKYAGRTVRLTATDPLAKVYDRLLAEHHIEPLVRTLPGEAVELLQLFGADRFDLVVCRNAMDHGHDPLGGIRNCLQVVKPGGWVVLEHFANEGETNHYQGLHAWNFDERNGRFVIWNPTVELDVENELADLADKVECKLANRWIGVGLRRRR